MNSTLIEASFAGVEWQGTRNQGPLAGLADCFATEDQCSAALLVSLFHQMWLDPIGRFLGSDGGMRACCETSFPVLATEIEDIIVALKDTVREPVVAHELLDVLNRVGFGRPRRVILFLCPTRASACHQTLTLMPSEYLPNVVGELRQRSIVLGIVARARRELGTTYPVPLHPIAK